MRLAQNIPPWLYQRYRHFFDRLPSALGMAALFALVDMRTGAFPVEWRTFIAVGVLVSGLLLPVAGYILFIVALAYPLFTISIYIAALALSVLILWAFLCSRHLGAVVLLLVTPLLVPYRLAPLVPLLAGLWWGEWGGALVGAGSALWLKLFAGMCGAAPDITSLSIQTLSAERLINRFHTANSLQTLLWMWEPLSPHPQALLLNILHILGWGLAGYGIGIMRQRMENMARPYLGLLAGISAAWLGFGVGSLAAPFALGLLRPSALPISHLANFLIELGMSSAAAVMICAAYRYLNRPVVPPSLRRDVIAYRCQETGSGDGMRAGTPATLPASPVSPPWAGPFEEDEQEDIIMLDLD